MIVRFSTVQHSHDAFPRNWEMDWDVLAARLARHDAGDKDGVALICATFTGPPRGKETLAERWLIGLDIEMSKKTGEVPPPPEVIARYMNHRKQAGVIWTTHGHTTLLPRYRVILPLDEPVRPLMLGKSVDNQLPFQMANELQLLGRHDAGKYGAESLFYLARHPTGTDMHWSAVVEGAPQKASLLVGVARTVVSGVQIRKAQLDQLRKTAEFPPELKAIIEAFNDSNELEDLFVEYGYRRMGGGRFKSKYQSPSTQAATAIFPDHTGWYSWSESDALAGVGHNDGDGGRFGDAFSLYTHYEHGNNFRAAIAALRERYGPREQGPVG